MYTIMSILRNPKHKRIIVFVRKCLLFFICLILLTTIDNLIADRVSKNWHPTLGFVFGVSIVACVGFFWLFPVLKKMRTMETTRTKKNLWISGMMLSILGCTVVLLHDSIVLINVLPLNITKVWTILVTRS